MLSIGFEVFEPDPQSRMMVYKKVMSQPSTYAAATQNLADV